MKRKNFFLCIVCAALFFTSVQSVCFAEKPYWWNNPHRDDEDNMYERGSAENCGTEQEALEQAENGARRLLMNRVGIVPSMQAAGLSPSPEYALVNCTEADIATEKTGRKWSAWVLLKYPQEEKKKLLTRWNTSVSSINELKKTESQIPQQFNLLLTTERETPQYQAGEQVSFQVYTGRDAYLVLLDHQNDGTTVLLFPNRFHPDCLIRSGENISIPDTGQSSFSLVIGAPFGDDRIEAIASTALTSLQKKMQDMLTVLPETVSVASSSRGIFIQGITNAVQTASKQVLWSRAELNLSTYPASTDIKKVKHSE
jgi:hypothetical protein